MSSACVRESGTGDVRPHRRPTSPRDTMPTSASAAAKIAADVAVDLALQGGGAHGAFTWGVLDRLLEEPHLKIDGISGTSAGAMNAAVLIDGHAAGGPGGAPGAPQ